MASKIQIRRDSSTNWASVDPVLADGEFGYELDTRKVKIGDNSSTWSELAYVSGASTLAYAQVTDRESNNTTTLETANTLTASSADAGDYKVEVSFDYDIEYPDYDLEYDLEINSASKRSGRLIKGSDDSGPFPIALSYILTTVTKADIVVNLKFKSNSSNSYVYIEYSNITITKVS